MCRSLECLIFVAHDTYNVLYIGFNIYLSALFYRGRRQCCSILSVLESHSSSFSRRWRMIIIPGVFWGVTQRRKRNVCLYRVKKTHNLSSYNDRESMGCSLIIPLNWLRAFLRGILNRMLRYQSTNCTDLSDNTAATMWTNCRNSANEFLKWATETSRPRWRQWKNTLELTFLSKS